MPILTDTIWLFLPQGAPSGAGLSNCLPFGALDILSSFQWFIVKYNTHREACCVWLKLASKLKCTAQSFIKEQTSRSRNRTFLAPQKPPLGCFQSLPLRPVQRCPLSCVLCQSFLALLRGLITYTCLVSECPINGAP